MSVSFFDLMKYASTGIAPPDMTGYDKLKALAMTGSYPVRTITGVPPLSFKANGKPLISWSMLGNGQQIGTPTPDAPIMPDFCGVRTANLFDRAGESEGKYISSSGTMTDGYQWYASDYIPVESSTTYTFNPNSQRGVSGKHAFYSSDKSFISYIDSGPQTFTTPANAAFIRFSYRTASYDIMLNTGSTALPYEPYGWAEKITCAGQTVPVYLGQVQTVRRIKKLVLTGEENWSNVGGQAPFQYTPSNFGMLSQDVAFYICSHYKAIAYNDSWTSNYKFVSATAQGLRFKDSSFNPSLDNFKSFLAAQYAAGTPVTVWYVLATPETAIVNEPLCKIGDYADELHSEDAGVSIPTAKGQNTLTVDTELQPSSMTITGNIKEM